MEVNVAGNYYKFFIFLFLCFFCVSCGSTTHTSETLPTRSSSTNTPIPTETPQTLGYDECINWMDAGLFDDEYKCVIGKIVRVDYIAEPIYGNPHWVARYTPSELSGFFFTSSQDITSFENECVAVYGELIDREGLELKNAAGYLQEPAIFDLSEFNEPGIKVESIPENLCDFNMSRYDFIVNQDQKYCKDSIAGNTVTCIIPKAICDYYPDLSGSPTFCHDYPYPKHAFTLLVWENDWSDYDGKCLVVTGFVSLYEGKPQIEVNNRSQVTFCP